MRFVFNGELELVVDYFHEDIVNNKLWAGKDYTEGFPDLSPLVGIEMIDSVQVFCGDTEIILNGDYNRIANLTADYGGEVFTVSLTIDKYELV